MKKIVWERYVVSVIVLESENRNKGTLAASEESKAKEKESDRLRKKRCIQSRTTLSSLPETLQITALPSSPLLTRGYNGYLLAYFRISFCTRHTLHMRIPSSGESLVYT